MGLSISLGTAKVTSLGMRLPHALPAVRRTCRFTLGSVADTPEETDATSGLPIWLLYQASVAAAACVPPGNAITDDNFNDAISGWFASGNASQYGDITKWCTGAVTDMREAFRDKTTFNKDIGAWDTSKVTDMWAMFYKANAFNQDIGSWETGNVTTMSRMFYDATNFNKNIGGWETGKVEYMGFMFYGATAFNQDLSSWDVNLVTACSDFATNADDPNPPNFTACTP